MKEKSIRYKILILNSTIDRETGPKEQAMGGLEFVGAIVRALNESMARGNSTASTGANTPIPSTADVLSPAPGFANGLKPQSSPYPASTGAQTATTMPDKSTYKNFVTHLIHLSGPGTPRVDKEEFAALGIECVRVYGRRNEGEDYIRYDEKALVQALEVLMGRRPEGGKKGMERSRRNTLEG